jgi:hypothetical protein
MCILDWRRVGVACCWTKQLLDALNFVMPESVDGVSWKNHMALFLPVVSNAVLHADSNAVSTASFLQEHHPVLHCTLSA